jgi:oligopeptide/dipeptide ABC transporter ATP-binding protein
MNNGSLLTVEHLLTSFNVNANGVRRKLRAVNDVSFNLFPQETLAVVGESGSGKTTLLRSIALLNRPEAGSITFDGDVMLKDGRIRKKPRGQIQMVFQNPEASLNPLMRVRDIISEPLTPKKLPKSEARAKVHELLLDAGLNDEFQETHPTQLSGGQMQRVSIARAIATNPKLVLLDEPTSSLYMVVQAQILNLLMGLQQRFALSYILVTHNISVARFISDRLVIFYLGKILEEGPVERIMSAPVHPYTRALLDAFPIPDPSKRTLLKTQIAGEPPSAIDRPSGCVFHPRCPWAQDKCKVEEPRLEVFREGQLCACHFADAIAKKMGAQPN